MDSFLSAITNGQKKCSCGKARCHNSAKAARQGIGEYPKNAEQPHGICSNQTDKPERELAPISRAFCRRYPLLPVASSTMKNCPAYRELKKDKAAKSGSNTSFNDENNYMKCRCTKMTETDERPRKPHKHNSCKNPKCAKRLRKDADHIGKSYKHDVKAISKPDHPTDYHRYVQSTGTAQNYPGSYAIDDFPPLPLQAIIQSKINETMRNESEVIGYTPGQYEYAGSSYPPLPNSRNMCRCWRDKREKSSSSSSSSSDQDEEKKQDKSTCPMLLQKPTACTPCCRRNITITQVFRPRSNSIDKQSMAHEINISPIPVRALRTPPPCKNCHTCMSPSFPRPTCEDVYTTTKSAMDKQQVTTIPHSQRGFYSDKSFVNDAESMTQDGEATEHQRVRISSETKCYDPVKCPRRYKHHEYKKYITPKICSTKSVLVRQKPPAYAVDSYEFKPCPTKCKGLKRDPTIRSETVDRYPRESPKPMVSNETSPISPPTETLYMRNKEMEYPESDLYITPEEDEMSPDEIYCRTQCPVCQSEPTADEQLIDTIVKQSNTPEHVDSETQEKIPSASILEENVGIIVQSSSSSNYATPIMSESKYDTPANADLSSSKGSLPKDDDGSSYEFYVCDVYDPKTGEKIGSKIRKKADFMSPKSSRSLSLKDRSLSKESKSPSEKVSYASPEQITRTASGKVIYASRERVDETPVTKNKQPVPSNIGETAYFSTHYIWSPPLKGRSGSRETNRTPSRKVSYASQQPGSEAPVSQGKQPDPSIISRKRFFADNIWSPTLQASLSSSGKVSHVSPEQTNAISLPVDDDVSSKGKGKRFGRKVEYLFGEKISQTSSKKGEYTSIEQTSIISLSVKDKISSEVSQPVSRRASKESNGMVSEEKDEDYDDSPKYVICDSYSPTQGKRTSPSTHSQSSAISHTTSQSSKKKTAKSASFRNDGAGSISSSIFSMQAYKTANSSQQGSEKLIPSRRESKQSAVVIKIQKIEQDLRSLSAKSLSIQSSQYVSTKDTQSLLSDKVSSQFTSFHSARGDSSSMTSSILIAQKYQAEMRTSEESDSLSVISDEKLIDQYGNVTPYSAATSRDKTPHDSAHNIARKMAPRMATMGKRGEETKKSGDEVDAAIGKSKWRNIKDDISHRLFGSIHHPYARKLLKSLLFFLLGLKVCSEAWYMVIPIYGAKTAIARCICPD